MTRKQMIFVIFVNAVISALISVAVALFVILPSELASISTPSAGGPPVGAVVAVTVAAQLGEPSSMEVEDAGPTSTPVTYIVQPGDTISSLALKFDVPGADIMAVNELQNPDYLQAGVEIIIPVGGLPPATATWTPIPTATYTPIPFEPPSAGLTANASSTTSETITATPAPLPVTGEHRIEISEIMGVGEVGGERVIITNVGERLADMQGWTLSDAEGNIYVFPNFRLWGGGSVTVHTSTGQDGTPLSSLYWGKLEPVWSPREVATLKDADGQVIVTYFVAP